jgi:hypothetical protein
MQKQEDKLFCRRHIDLTGYSVMLVASFVVPMIKGVTGRGFSTSCLPVMTRFWPVHLAVVPGLLVGLAILVSINGDFAKAVPGLNPGSSDYEKKYLSLHACRQ